MRIPSVATPAFWEQYRQLPTNIQALDRKNYHLWRQNILHPSVRFKRIGGSN